jgi:transposase
MMEHPMKRDDLSRSLVAFDQNSTLVATVELSAKTWLVAGLVPGLDRDPLKKLGADADALLALLHRWRHEATKTGSKIDRVVVAFEAGRDGFWLARWLRAQGIEGYVIHPTSIPVSREHRRAKSDRLDTALLMRALLGWLRGEARHCSMVKIPTLAQEDAKRPSRELEYLTSERTSLLSRVKAALVRNGFGKVKLKLRKPAEWLASLRSAEGVALPPHTLAELGRDIARLTLIRQQIKEIETERLKRLQREPGQGMHPMLLMLTRFKSIGIGTADVLTHEAFMRELRDDKAIGRYGGLSGAPDESGTKRREKGLARAGNARVRRIMLQLAWRWLMFQKDSALAQWYRARTAHARRDIRKKMIVALARKLLIALWRYVTTGEVPAGAVMKPAV